MSVASDVVKEYKEQFEAGTSGYFYPTGTRYPHLHINNSFCGYSVTANGSKTFVRGDTIYWGVVDELLGEPNLDPIIRSVILYVDSTWERPG